MASVRRNGPSEERTFARLIRQPKQGFGPRSMRRISAPCNRQLGDRRGRDAVDPRCLRRAIESKREILAQTGGDMEMARSESLESGGNSDTRVHAVAVESVPKRYSDLPSVRVPGKDDRRSASQEREYSLRLMDQRQARFIGSPSLHGVHSPRAAGPRGVCPGDPE